MINIISCSHLLQFAIFLFTIAFRNLKVYKHCDCIILFIDQINQFGLCPCPILCDSKRMAERITVPRAEPSQTIVLEETDSSRNQVITV